MKRLFLYFLLISTSVQAQSWKNYHLIAGCKILSITGEVIKGFPGLLCLFLEDGSYISADETGIRRISATSSKLWELPGHYHHQLNFSYDKQKILALSSSVYRENERQDKFQVISLDGKVLHEKSFSDLLIRSAMWDLQGEINKVAVDGVQLTKEFSHFNSFYEIGPLTPAKGRPDWLKSGNYILNGLRQGFFVLSPDLTEIHHNSILLNANRHHVHDVQVTKRGTILYFNNLVKDGKKMLKNFLGGGTEPEKRYSGIYEVNPVTQKVIRKFEANPKELFFAWMCGGVQELDDETWLFNHFLSGAFIYSHKTKKVWNRVVTTNADWFTHHATQQVNAADLSKFLQHWK